MTNRFIERPVLTEGSTLPIYDNDFLSFTRDWSTFRHNHPSLSDEYSEGIDTISSTESQGLSLSYKETRGWNLSNYATLRKSGKLLPFTPFIQTEVEGYLAGDFDLKYIHPYGSPLVDHPQQYHTDVTMLVRSNGPYLPPGFWSNHASDLLPDLDAVRANATLLITDEYVTAAASEIYTSGFDAGTSAAEFHQVINMIINLKRKILKGDVGELYNLWLEGRYGWRVLIYEIQDLHDTITKFDKKRTRFTEYAHHVDRSTSVLTDPDLYLIGLPDGLLANAPYYRIKYNIDSTISYRGTVSADFQPNQWRFDLLNTAWELVPYSFVVDWFLAVGEWINAMYFAQLKPQFEAAQGINLVQTITPEVYETGLYNFNSAIIDEAHLGFSISGSTRVSVTRRDPIRDIPLTPRSKSVFDLSLLKVLDLTALISQLVAGPKRSRKSR